jgi:hypothetical protein
MTGVRVSFKVDPRITQGHYHGDRWVSPPTFTLIVQAASPVVSARAHLAQDGGLMDASATWTAADPSMIAISPAEGHEVAITILTAGQSAITVATAQGSNELAVTAAHDAGNWRVEVAQ